MITERTLRRWRQDALRELDADKTLPKEGKTTEIIRREEDKERILRLTQELLDQHLLNDRRKS